MSKPVRLADYLYAQVEELAAAEKRSLANMVQVLLEQALKIERLRLESFPPPVDPKLVSQVTRTRDSHNPDSDVKTDFK